MTSAQSVLNESLLEKFRPGPLLTSAKANADCLAVVVIPARNEEASIPDALDALNCQVDVLGNPLDPKSFEVLLLLNNCTDQSVEVATAWKRSHPSFPLQIFERTLERAFAHVGTARKLLMDTAWNRLRRRDDVVRGIISTDSDTVVSQDWIARTIAALKGGADAVGGKICLKPGDLDLLPLGARKAYLRDRKYQGLVAQLESILDPRNGDPWPRHLEHFGASLACTPTTYAMAAGMPAVTPLEDVAFVHRLNKVGAVLRHDPSVVVYTSSRLDGRAEIGLSHQLRTWQGMSERKAVHFVPSAEWLEHRMRMLHELRSTQAPGEHEHWEVMIAKSFTGERDGFIVDVNRRLASMIRHLTNFAMSDRSESRMNPSSKSGELGTKPVAQEHRAERSQTVAAVPLATQVS